MQFRLTIQIIKTASLLWKVADNMVTSTVQPIAGVSSQSESEIMTVYPSIGSKGLGRGLGSLYELIPLGNSPVKLSHLLFTLPTSPLALIGYFVLKILGDRYKLTNRSLQVWKSLGHQLVRQVNLSEIGEVTVEQLPGQVFYKCADIHLMGKDGKPLLTLGGIPRAEVFRQTIIKARDAVDQVKSSLATIEARQTA